MSDSPTPSTTRDADWVVWSYEHDAWWGENRHGYRNGLLRAGLYTEAEAKEIECNANAFPNKNAACGLFEKAMPLREAIERERIGRPDTPIIDLLCALIDGSASRRETTRDEVEGLLDQLYSAQQALARVPFDRDCTDERKAMLAIRSSIVRLCVEDAASLTEEAPTPPAIDNATFRRMVIARVEKAMAQRDDPKECGHAGHMEYSTCVVCAWHLGRTEGHVEAGAYSTHEEFFGELRAKFAAASPSTTEPAPTPRESFVATAICTQCNNRVTPAEPGLCIKCGAPTSIWYAHPSASSPTTRSVETPTVDNRYLSSRGLKHWLDILRGDGANDHPVDVIVDHINYLEDRVAASLRVSAERPDGAT